MKSKPQIERKLPPSLFVPLSSVSAEADVFGEDLVIRIHEGELRSVQMKAVHLFTGALRRKRNGGNDIWMLFPDPDASYPGDLGSSLNTMSYSIG